MPLFSPVAVVVTLVSRTSGRAVGAELLPELGEGVVRLRLRGRRSSMLCERSMTSATTSGSGACVSFTRSGPASANRRMAKASPRAQAPRARVTNA